MKKTIAYLAAISLIFCSCGKTENPPQNELSEAITEASEFSEAVSETSLSETETENTVTEKASPCFTYSGNEPCLKALSEIAESLPADTVMQYDFSDIDGDFEEELLILAPHIDEPDKMALYAISRSGEYLISPSLYSAEESFEGCAGYVDKDNKPCIALASWNSRKEKFTAYYMTPKLDSAETKNVRYIDSTGFHPEKALWEYHIPFSSAEDISSEELAERLISELEKTPLERAEEYSNQEGGILADLTGDSFPEMITIGWDGYVTDLGWSAYDMSGRYPVMIASGILDENETVKLISKEGKPRSLVSAYSLRCASGYGFKTADITELRYPYKFSSDLNSDNLGTALFYINGGYTNEEKKLAYLAELYMDGREYEGRGYFEYESGYIENAFDKMYGEFLSEWDILLEIGLDENDEIYIVGDNPEFADSPEINNAPFGEGEALEYIEICGELYRTDSSHVTIKAEELSEDFDFSVLNSFTELRSVSLSGDPESGKKVKITPSEWCGKIKELIVSPVIYEIEGGYGCFENVRSICVSGVPESIEFITEMENIEVFSCEYAPNHDFLRPLMKLPKLAVIQDSGMWSFLEESEWNNMPEDMRTWIESNNIIWAMIKVG